MSLRATLPIVLLGLIAQTACEQQPADAPPTSPIHVRTVRPARHRAKVASATIRFAHSGVEPGKVTSGYDRLQVGAVFADVGRRDAHIVGDLTGQSDRGPRLHRVDTCIRQAGPLNANAQTAAKPTEHLQLLDVGNVSLLSGERKKPLKISLVPSLFSAVRGVRYDLDLDGARGWLAASTLTLVATGGDGISPFTAKVQVPRPVRLTRVGGKPVRGGQVVVPADPAGLSVRWGSVDGTASLAIVVGAERGKGLDWVRCRLADDGAFVVPTEVLKGLPARSARRPWLISLVRSTSAKIPGFPGKSLRLELVDSVRAR